MYMAGKSGTDKFLANVKNWHTLHPLWFALIGFLVGGPISAAVLFIIWKTPWHHKAKLYVSIGFVVIFTLVQLIFAKQILEWSMEQFNQLQINP